MNLNEKSDPEKSIGNLKDLPAGTKVEFEKLVDATTPGGHEVTVVVTYPDGFQDKIEVTIKVVAPNKPVIPSKPEVKPEMRESITQMNTQCMDQETLPNTGERPNAGAIALDVGMLISAIGLKARRRREED